MFYRRKTGFSDYAPEYLVAMCWLMHRRELIRELRRENPHLKGLIITGYMVEEDLRDLEQEGILDVMRNPVDLKTLADVVRGALDLR